MNKNNKYAVCQGCHKPMAPHNGCTVSHIYMNGKKYERIKAGATPGFDDDMSETDVCHDCNAGAGQYHHFGCDMERCPCCLHQVISCDCFLE